MKTLIKLANKYILNQKAYQMQAEKKVFSKLYNGFQTPNNNFIWAGAMCLAWTQLKNNIIKENIKLDTKDEEALRMIENFNADRFKADHIDSKCVYVKSGYGKETMHLINKQVKQKFPEKTFPDLNLNLRPDSIISYAYLLKKLQFKAKFQKLPNKLLFNGKKEFDAFYATQNGQKKQISKISFDDGDNFAIAIQSKNPNDYICFIKSSNHLTVQEAIKKTQGFQTAESIRKSDQFMMPIVDFDMKRTIKQLKLKVQNQKFASYSIDEIFQGIKLRVDQAGAKVENEAVIALNRCRPQCDEYILDKPFWIVMRQAGKHPYLVAFVNHPCEVAEL